jgi:methylglyoxal/glyoxal reductase
MSAEDVAHEATGPALHSIADRIEIAPRVLMPRLGVGTSHVVGMDAVANEITSALILGYRLIDTATAYRNESEIGVTLQRAGVPREELFLTSKVWASDQGYESTLRACEASRSKLRTDYLDLYLIHWPESSLTAETWRAFEKLHAEGLVRAIGVSNFMKSDFARLDQMASVQPAVDQIEFHPYLQRPRLVDYCHQRGVTVEAYSPLLRGRMTLDAGLRKIGSRYDKTAAQVTLRWILQRGLVTIPKSANAERLRENADIYDFSLTPEEMTAIDQLDRGRE